MPLILLTSAHVARIFGSSKAIEKEGWSMKLSHAGRAGLFFLLAIFLACIPGTSVADENKEGADRLIAKFMEQFKSNLPVGSMAPEFSLSDLNGKKHSLAEFRGKTVVVHFWALWCPPCVREMPELRQFAKKHPDIVVLGICQETDPASGASRRLLSFARKTKITFTVLVDAMNGIPGSVAGLYDAKAIPATFIVGPDGKIVYKATGAIKWKSFDPTKLLGPKTD